MKKYVYPKLSHIDLLAFRLGGAGLGNLLFTYARALKYAAEHNCEMIWPTWPSLKIGTWLRNEKDKRTYTGLFKNKLHYASGLKKAFLLTFAKKYTEEQALENGFDGGVAVFEKFIGSFTSISDIHETVRENLLSICARDNFSEFDFSASIAIHVRLGDFNKVSEKALLEGKHDSRLPIEWYCEILKGIREIAGRQVKAYIFSDGTDEELKILTDMPSTQRLTFGNALNDIFALSNAPLLVASGSSFSMWARYLGRHNTICFTNQIKEKILTSSDDAFEIETSGEIPQALHEKIRQCLKV